MFFDINILKKLLKKATMQRTNYFFRMVIYHNTAKRRIMPCRKCGPKKISIPARSPDMTTIENVFNYVRTKLHEESLNRNITFENVEEFLLLLKTLYYQCQLNI